MQALWKCISQIKASTSPHRVASEYLNFCKIGVKFPTHQANKLFIDQMPHHKSIVGEQMPPGKFKRGCITLSTEMLLKLSQQTEKHLHNPLPFSHQSAIIFNLSL